MLCTWRGGRGGGIEEALNEGEGDIEEALCFRLGLQYVNNVRLLSTAESRLPWFRYL